MNSNAVIIVDIIVYNHLVGGFSPPLWKILVSWDDEIPNIWKKNVPNHQPAIKSHKTTILVG